LGKEHPHTLTVINNLGFLYESQGRYREAEEYYKRALTLRKKILGEDHPDTLTSINNLAFLYQSQGRHREADPLYKEALLIKERGLQREDQPVP
jgi:tetratricopeptide (TPR) repeat protein